MQRRCKHPISEIEEAVCFVGTPRSYITLTLLELELECKRLKLGGGQAYDRSSD
jgi:hypothetical protein